MEETTEKKTEKKQIVIIPYGWVKEIMDETGYSRLTVSSAVRYNTRGVKAEHVRQLENTGRQYNVMITRTIKITS